MQGLLTSLLLPPLGLVLACALGGLLAWRGWRQVGLMVALAAMLQMLLATPYVADLLLSPLQRAAEFAPAPVEPPGAIVILGAEVVRTAGGNEIGPLTLERLRAGAVLARQTGLPVLVTGGVIEPGTQTLGSIMARSLSRDFGVPVRWVEERARDTRENAVFSAAMLREAGIGAAHLVSHGWHLPRAREAFARQGFPILSAPVHLEPPPAGGSLAAWFPRPDHLAMSWFALREWVGRLVYALRD